MNVQVLALRYSRVALALGFTVLTCWGCSQSSSGDGPAGPPGESSTSRASRRSPSEETPVPLVAVPDSQPREEVGIPIADAVDGDAKIIANEGMSYRVSCVLRNIISEDITIDLGPLTWVRPDGERAVLAPPRVGLVLRRDDEWVSIDDQATFGKNWRPVHHLRVGDNCSFAIDFKVADWARPHLSAGESVALAVFSYGGDLKTVVGELILPIALPARGVGN